MRSVLFYWWAAVLLAACQVQPSVSPAAPALSADATSVVEVAVPPTVEVTAVTEQPVQLIPLAGPAAASEAEFSGMAWYGDTLILLPQFPDRFDGQIFALSRVDIVAYLDGAKNDPLTPQSIPFAAPGLAQLPGYEGLEAIAFHGDQVFVTIETSNGAPMMGYLISGQIAPDLSQIELDMSHLEDLVPPAALANFSDETLLLTEETVLTIYEANGRAVNPRPAAHQFNTNLEPLGTMVFPTVEYRVTDATVVDENGRFWVINYLFPGDIDKLEPAADELGKRYGRGPTHAASDVVERLIEMQISPGGITLTDTPPIQLKLLPDGEARNWEGIVRLDSRGFLIITDTFPETLLGFVATVGSPTN